jgi:para-aminobenzoate synthetase component 2
VPARIAVIDNYDSFVYNLVQYLGALGAEPVVVRNDEVDVAGLEALGPSGLLISPGPGRPDSAGVSLAAVDAFSGCLPILGVCLGHQCIAQAAGAVIRRASHLMHGKTSEVSHDGRGVFTGLPQPLTATRYHSLDVDPATLPATLEATAWAEDGALMGVRHRSHPTEGVQFHPESVLTGHGHALIANWLAGCGALPVGAAEADGRRSSPTVAR